MEHRCSKRATTAATALIHYKPQQIKAPGRITNYSHGGMYLNIRPPEIRRFQPVDIEIMDQTRDSFYRIPAIVVRVEESGLAVELDPDDTAARTAVESLRRA